MTSSPARLNKARTLVLGAFAVVWFAEAALWSVRPLSEVWSRFWQMFPPDDAQLATGLYLTHAVEAAAKSALGVLAVYALQSRTPFVRSALFVPMALVPTLNVLFRFRAEGFPLRSTLIGATLSVILWDTFFLLKDRAAPGLVTGVPSRPRTLAADSLQNAWFAVNALVLTMASALFLFTPDAALRLAFPCFSSLVDVARAVPSSLTLAGLGVGTHLTAVATATWVAVACTRTHAAVRQAVTAANIVHAALLCVLPLAQLGRETGRDCATNSLLIYSVPLLASWLAYAAFFNRTGSGERVSLTHPAGH